MSPITDQQILDVCESLQDESTAFLDKLIRFESLPGYEGPAMHWLYEQFQGLGDVVELVPIPESIRQDPEYQFTLSDLPYSERPNLRVTVKGSGGGRTLVTNAHVDVVPPSYGQERPFDPVIKDGCSYGRGAVDDKGQVAAIWVILKAMKKLGVRPKGDVVFHIVIEEETGGNGTLAIVRDTKEKFDLCVNFESGRGHLYTSLRGAVWFKATVWGRAAHSGNPQAAVNAIDMAIEAIRIMKEVREEILAETRNDDPVLAKLPNPMPLNFGEFNSGDDPSIAARKATFSGVFGLLTTPHREVMRRIEEAVRTRGPEWLKDPEHFQIEFPYHHDISRTDPNHESIPILKECWKMVGVNAEVMGLSASSDACFYTNIMGTPTVMTGYGNETAHQVIEHMNLHNVVLEAAMMVRFVREWCGENDE
ncbi:M20/M25/M40 family metallo-hydrolase [bacterium]|nr:M20/M25/M40 family metallo-hydrolase [bacterium]